MLDERVNVWSYVSHLECASVFVVFAVLFRRASLWSYGVFTSGQSQPNTKYNCAHEE